MSKLYRHYKNKKYRFLDEVRHSETLETMVLYEALYPNELGKLWVRPKEMFHGEVQHQDQAVPRFEKLRIEYSQTSSLSPNDLEEILSLLDQVFGDFSRKKLLSTIQNRTQLLLISAKNQGHLIGFKLGYAYNHERFYSWLGAVHPDFRRGGIAQELMQRQHLWCREQSFKVIETRTKNKWQAMLILNIENGFQVVGTYTNSNGETKIILEKKLIPA